MLGEVMLGETLLMALSLGAFYSLLGIAFYFSWEGAGVVNIAFGEMALVVPYVLLLLHRKGGWSWYAAMWPALLSAFLWAPLLWMMVRRLVGLATLVFTLGLAFVLQRLMVILFTVDYRVLEVEWRGVELGGILWPGPFVMLFGVSWVVILCLLIFFRTTMKGLAMRAYLQDKTLAALLGVSGEGAKFFFLLGGLMLTGLSGFLFSIFHPFNPFEGLKLTIAAFTVALLTRGGRLAPLLVGGVLLGVAETMAGYWAGYQWQEGARALALLGAVAWRSWRDVLE